MTASPRSGQPVAPERVQETPPTGLTDAEVRERVEQGATNATGERTSRTFGEILHATREPIEFGDDDRIDLAFID